MCVRLWVFTKSLFFLFSFLFFSFLFFSFLFFSFLFFLFFQDEVADPFLRDSFLITYRAFVTPVDLLDHLITRFPLPSPFFLSTPSTFSLSFSLSNTNQNKTKTNNKTKIDTNPPTCQNKQL